MSVRPIVRPITIWSDKSTSTNQKTSALQKNPFSSYTGPLCSPSVHPLSETSIDRAFWIDHSGSLAYYGYYGYYSNEPARDVRRGAKSKWRVCTHVY